MHLTTPQQLAPFAELRLRDMYAAYPNFPASVPMNDNGCPFDVITGKPITAITTEVAAFRAHACDPKGPSYWATRARKFGHDGLILTSDDYESGERAFVVFHPTQVKSARGNGGGFDGANPDFLA
jgi:hypothetical protein